MEISVLEAKLLTATARTKALETDLNKYKEII